MSFGDVENVYAMEIRCGDRIGISQFVEIMEQYNVPEGEISLDFGGSLPEYAAVVKNYVEGEIIMLQLEGVDSPYALDPYDVLHVVRGMIRVEELQEALENAGEVINTNMSIGDVMRKFKKEELF